MPGEHAAQHSEGVEKQQQPHPSGHSRPKDLEYGDKIQGFQLIDARGNGGHGQEGHHQPQKTREVMGGKHRGALGGQGSGKVGRAGGIQVAAYCHSHQHPKAHSQEQGDPQEDMFGVV